MAGANFAHSGWGLVFAAATAALHASPAHTALRRLLAGAHDILHSFIYMAR